METKRLVCPVPSAHSRAPRATHRASYVVSTQVPYTPQAQTPISAYANRGSNPMQPQPTARHARLVSIKAISLTKHVQHARITTTALPAPSTPYRARRTAVVSFYPVFSNTVFVTPAFYEFKIPTHTVRHAPRAHFQTSTTRSVIIAPSTHTSLISRQMARPYAHRAGNIPTLMRVLSTPTTASATQATLSTPRKNARLVA
jgi:hypothetical protein